jgi:hypothetical protein
VQKPQAFTTAEISEAHTGAELVRIGARNSRWAHFQISSTVIQSRHGRGQGKLCRVDL